MPFEWDERKAGSNLRKHGIDFADATSVFDDVHSIEREDENAVQWKRRFQIIGNVDGVVILVVYAERGENIIRIISARQATRHERKLYENGCY